MSDRKRFAEERMKLALDVVVWAALFFVMVMALGYCAMLGQERQEAAQQREAVEAMGMSHGRW